MNPDQKLHPSFKLNGLAFESTIELIAFGEKLKENGDLYEKHIAKFLLQWFNDTPYIKVKTSGSTGKPKKIKLEKKWMSQSAAATGSYFKLGAGNTALLCLSTKYIAGKMMLVRALTLGWDLHVVAPEKDAITQYDNNYDFAAMVPYQVYYSIKKLNKIKKLIIGGGVISPELEALLQSKNTEAFATYGMTETCTHVAVRQINGAGKTNSYTAIPNVEFKVDQRGCLVIEAPMVASDTIITNDLVTLHTPKSFTYLGRIDNVINSGGIKIFPEQVEQQLKKTIQLPFVISSIMSKDLGEQLVLVVETKEESIPNYTEAFSALEPYHRPKKIFTLSKFPMTETGKVKRGEIKSVLKSFAK